jgi:peptide/nickel transport system ATP-binding protein
VETVRDLVLDVQDLRVHYGTPGGDVIAVNGVSFGVRRGEILGLVGESGCGKSTVAMSLLQLVQPPGRIAGGRVLLNGTDLLTLNEQQLRQVRWQQIALIPQGAMNSLNPVMRVHDQLADAIQTHEGKQSARALRRRIVDALATVGLPARVYDLFPHELSGGM